MTANHMDKQYEMETGFTYALNAPGSGQMSDVPHSAQEFIYSCSVTLSPKA